MEEELLRASQALSDTDTGGSPLVQARPLEPDSAPLPDAVPISGELPLEQQYPEVLAEPALDLSQIIYEGGLNLTFLAKEWPGIPVPIALSFLAMRRSEWDDTISYVLAQLQVALTTVNEPTKGAIGGAVDQVNGRVDQLDGAVKRMVERTDYDGLTTRVNRVEIDMNAISASISLLATKQSVSDMEQRFTDVGVRLDAMQGKIDLWATDVRYNTLETKISDARLLIDGANAAIALKASQKIVDALGTRVSNAEIDIDGAKGSISLLSTRSDGFEQKFAAITIDAQTGIKLVGEKVVFSTGKDIATVMDEKVAPVQTTANTAKTTADKAAADAAAALASVGTAASDDLLIPTEKRTIIMLVGQLNGEQSGIDAQALAYNITTEKDTYDSAITALNGYLATLTVEKPWNDLSGSTTIVGATFKQKFQDAYNARQALFNRIYALAKGLADQAGTSANQALAKLSDMAADAKLTPVEKKRLRVEWKAIYADWVANMQAAALYANVDSQKSDYDAAFKALAKYLNGGTDYVSGYPLWISDGYLDATTAIDGAAFVENFRAYYQAQTFLLNALTSCAKSAADTANQLIGEIASDAKLSAVEKLALRREWDAIAADRPKYEAIAGYYALTVERDAYTAAFTALATYLNNGVAYASGVPAWIADANLGVTTDVVGATFRQKFADYYAAQTAILQRMGEQSSSLIGSATQSASNAEATANTAKSTADQAKQEASSATAKLLAIASDSKLTEGEKPSVMMEYAKLTGEQSGIDAQLTSYLITTEKTAYDTAISALTTYLNGLTAPKAWNDLSGETDLDGPTFRQKFADVYATRQTALNLIYSKAKAIADGAVERLNSIDSDGKLTPMEKGLLRAEWDAIYLDKGKLEAMADSFGATAEKTSYLDKFSALATYLNGGVTYGTGVPLWIADANLSTTTDLSGTTLRARLSEYYDAAAVLLRKCTDMARVSATTANQSIATISSDNALSVVEKKALLLQYNQLVAEKSGLDAEADNLGVTTEKTAYDNALAALDSYLSGLTLPVAWNVLTDYTTIVGATFRQKFQDAYAARQMLMNKLYRSLKGYADSLDNGVREAMAKSLGYDSYEAFYTETITNGRTIIQGGFLHTELIDVQMLFAKELSVDNMHLKGRVGDFSVSNKLVGYGYTNGVLNGNEIVLDPSNNEIVLAKNGAKRVRLTNNELTALALLHVDGGTKYCTTGTSVSNAVTTNALLASKTSLGVGGAGLSKTSYVGVSDTTPQLMSAVADITKISLSVGYYSMDVPYAFNIVHNGQKGDNNTFHRITGCNQAKIEVKLMNAAGVVKSTSESISLNVDTEKTGASPVFYGTARFNFAVSATDSYWVEATITVVGGSDRPIRYQSWNSGNALRSGWWSEQYDMNVQYELSLRPGLSVDGSIGITEISNNGIQSVWTPSRYIRIDGNTSNNNFIESQGTWVHNGYTVTFDPESLKTIIGIDPAGFASRTYVDEGFYNKTQSDARFLGISATAADSSKLGGVAAAGFYHSGNFNKSDVSIAALDVNVSGRVNTNSMMVNKTKVYSSTSAVNDLLSMRRYSADYTLVTIDSPPQTSWGKAKEATLAICRGDNSEYFMDLYNMDYGSVDAGNFLDYGDAKMGLRMQKRGTGIYVPFHFEYSAGQNEQRVLTLLPGASGETVNDTSVYVWNRITLDPVAIIASKVVTDLNTAMTTNRDGVDFYRFSSSATNRPTDIGISDGFVQSFSWHQSNYGLQLAFDVDGTGIGFRARKSDATWNSWLPVYTSNNLNRSDVDFNAKNLYLAQTVYMAANAAHFKVTTSGVDMDFRTTGTGRFTFGFNTDGGSGGLFYYGGTTQQKWGVESTGGSWSSQYFGSKTFTSGYLGAGTRLDTTSSGGRLEIDNIIVRNALRAHIFQKDVVRACNGYLFITDVSEIVANSATTDATLYIYVKDQVFQSGDILWYKDSDNNGNIPSSIKINITNAGESVTLPNSAKTGYRYTYTSAGGSGSFLVGGTIVRVGSTVAGRQGTIYLCASDSNSPFLDVYDGVSVIDEFRSASKVKVRLGKLDGITDSVFGSLSGYGLYAGVAYLTGGVNANVGKIGGWTINASQIISANGTIILDNERNRVVCTANGTPTAGARVQLYCNSSTDYGIWGTPDGAASNFKLGSSNVIAGWSFDTTRLFKGTALGNATLGTVDGDMTIGDGYISGRSWFIARNGATQFGGGNFAIASDGSVAIGKVAGHQVLIDASGNAVYTGKLTANQLNAAKATILGAVTAGSFNIGNGKFIVNSEGVITAISGKIGSLYLNGGELYVNYSTGVRRMTMDSEGAISYHDSNGTPRISVRSNAVDNLSLLTAPSEDLFAMSSYALSGSTTHNVSGYQDIINLSYSQSSTSANISYTTAKTRTFRTTNIGSSASISLLPNEGQSYNDTYNHSVTMELLEAGTVVKSVSVENPNISAQTLSLTYDTKANTTYVVRLTYTWRCNFFWEMGNIQSITMNCTGSCDQFARVAPLTSATLIGAQSFTVFESPTLYAYINKVLQSVTGAFSSNSIYFTAIQGSTVILSPNGNYGIDISDNGLRLKYNGTWKTFNGTSFA